MKSWFRRGLVTVVVGVFAAALWAGPAAAQLASTPYMGWNTYYGLGRALSESTIESVANSLISSGLAQAGYRIVWLDAGWATGARDSSGQLIVDPSLWPDGMVGLTNWLHQRGLEAGIYTDGGASGCGGGGVGSYGHYQQDANTFAAWGFDAVKVDFCGGGQEGFPPQPLYAQFAQAVSNNASGRPMIFNVDNFWEPGQIDGTHPSLANSSWGNYQWSPPIAQSWRTDTDVGFGHGGGILFSDVLRNLDADAAHPEAAGPGHWNDPDYLGPELGMTSAQAQAQLSMWAILAAPLILGSDPRSLSAGSLAMLENPNLIAIDQDPLGAQGTLFGQQGSGQIWVKPLNNGDRAVALLNRGSSPQQISTVAWHVGLPPTGNYHITDVWQNTLAGTTGGISASLPPSSVALYRVSAIPNSAYYTMTNSVTGSGSGRVSSDPGGISCPGACSLTVGRGVPVTLTATPSPGSIFTGWSGGGCSGTGACFVTMGSNQAVTATFTALRALKVSLAGTGSGSVTSSPTGISCPDTCSIVIGQGAHVTLTPTTRSGSAFAGWSGAGCSGPKSCVVTMGSNEAVTATLTRSSGSGPPSSTGSGVSNIVWCTAPFGKYCYFTETLTTVETISGGKVSTIRAAGKGKRATKVVVVGRKKTKVAGGHTVTVTVGLNSTGRQFLKQFGNVPVTLRVELLRAGKLVTIAKRKLTIKPKKTAPKKPSHGPLLWTVRVDWPAL
ncbi:MAG: hypothetical protein E6G05_03310 [Actinobacteria bacterium]|nr:MAG: hypothetical protein E6G05_03310 [Actinomycetota bacterium]